VILIIVVLGKRDSPTDAVEDYCRLLGGALEERGIVPLLVRVPWDENGCLRPLLDLWRAGAAWKGDWALIQYTALMWSRSGLPFLFLIVLSLLKLRKARVAAVFHDPEPYAGMRLVDKLRHACQLFVMRCAYRLSEASIVCVPLESVSWLPANAVKARFIPVGANVPARTGGPVRNGHGAKTVAVFAITDDGDISREVSDIAFAAKAAAERVPRLRLVTLGRGSLEAEPRFRRLLEGSPVEYRALGVLSAAEVSRVLSSSDLSLFVRGPVSTQRTSALASIACGLPLVAYAGPYLPTPLAEAGVVAVLYGDREGLVEAAVRVLSDRQLRLDLRQRSQRAYEKYFSWEAVAACFVNLLYHA
jgi:glycosyltransferase involved in cell wall biosynthesis